MVLNLSNEISDILLNPKRNSEIKSKDEIKKIVADGFTLKGNQIQMNYRYWGKHIPMKDLLMGFEVSGGCFVFSRSEFCVSSGIKNITNVFSISDFRRIKVVRGGLISDNIELDGKVIGKFNRQSIKPWNKIFDEINPVFETYFEKPLKQREIEEAAADEEVAEEVVEEVVEEVANAKDTSSQKKKSNKKRNKSKEGNINKFILLLKNLSGLSVIILYWFDFTKCDGEKDGSVSYFILLLYIVFCITVIKNLKPGPGKIKDNVFTSKWHPIFQPIMAFFYGGLVYSFFAADTECDRLLGMIYYHTEVYLPYYLTIAGTFFYGLFSFQEWKN
jgi:hypothetical protein